MYLIVIAWLYVTLMMALAEATNPTGSVLGAIVTFLLYGLAPMALVVYLMATPARKRKIKAREAAEHEAWLARQAAAAPAAAATSGAPDAGGHAPGAAQAPGIAPVGKET
ncbi:MAG: hypothetical protein Q8S02_15595 [Hydrogenophaga sp.]|nr:hypothetical protein [Hydrogenophaga sp.]